MADETLLTVTYLCYMIKVIRDSGRGGEVSRGGEL